MNETLSARCDLPPIFPFLFRKSDPTLFGTDQIRCPEEFCISCIVCNNDHRANGSNKIYRSSVVVKANSLRSWGSQSMLWTVFTGAILVLVADGRLRTIDKITWRGEGVVKDPLPPRKLRYRYYCFEYSNVWSCLTVLSLTRVGKFTSVVPWT